MQQNWPAVLTRPDEYLADPGPRSEIFSMVRNPLPTSWNFGYAVAKAYAGHTDNGSDTGATATYVRATTHEVAAALAALTGEPHPLATQEGW